MATFSPIPSLSPFDNDVPGVPAFLDDLTLMRNYCMATDTFVARSLEAQQPAKDVLRDLFKACNCAPVFSEGRLKSIPWSEISTVGNGVIYTAPTAQGPVFDLDQRHFIIKNSGDLPLKVTRPKLFDVVNVVSVQFVNRDREYNDSTAMASDTALIAQYGPIRSDPQKNEWIHDADLARRVAQLLLWGGDPTSPNGGGTIARNRYSFILPPHLAALFEPMDLVTVTDLTQGIYRRPVRLLSFKEQDDLTAEVEAEDFIYGAHASPGPPIDFAVLPTPTTNLVPGAVNPPFIFEPVPALDSASQDSVRLWMAVSGASPNYGGCHVWLSTDGGSSYRVVGAIAGSAVMGYSLNDLPVAVSPDLTDSLSLNLAQSRGALDSFTSAEEDLLESLCYLSPGGSVNINGQPATVPYELIAYQTATLLGNGQYQIGTRLLRGVDGTPIVDHPIGSQFAFLDARIFKLTLDSSYFGQTLYFKFTAFNTLGQQEQSLADAVAYSFTPSAWPASGGGGGFYVNGGTP